MLANLSPFIQYSETNTRKRITFAKDNRRVGGNSMALKVTAVHVHQLTKMCYSYFPQQSLAMF